jgi:hypothetical protein
MRETAQSGRFREISSGGANQSLLESSKKSQERQERKKGDGNLVITLNRTHLSVIINIGWGILANTLD